ncbi:hypothetical protein ENSA5_49460 [Enhygromyxa salina]|uniref:Uncharacterized protein n=1 Tax=Enhygromyxa salina TaxID=215803 RepID=A0A2S9XHT8_9BACT|nr:ribulose phosphate epimerase [Enhygromyxa salina]PRP92438.1 hypothetical protein ENSA5_49460 [Enhygromyxa salina]
MMQEANRWLVVIASAGLLACGDGPKLVGETGGEDVGATETSGASDLGDPDGDETETTEGEASFVPDIGDGEAECDPWAQDCPGGEKCVPYGSTGGNWDANKCVPVLGEGQPGDSCTYEGTSLATDSCGPESHCWDVMEVDGQLEGVCTSFCDGSADSPLCDPGTSCLIANEGSITLCIDTCDPLLQGCSEGLGCFWANNDFQCIFTAGEIPEAEACAYINDCAPGLTCAAAEVLPSCSGSSCCAAYCDLAAPDCPQEGTECTPFFEEGLAPPTYEDVGLCILPGA